MSETDRQTETEKHREAEAERQTDRKGNERRKRETHTDRLHLGVRGGGFRSWGHMCGGGEG